MSLLLPRLSVTGDVELVTPLRELGVRAVFTAATAVMFRLASVVATEVRVAVDRPFLLVVRHAGTGAVYFLARVTDPTS